MGGHHNPIQALRQMAEDHYGDFEMERGNLTMVFSRELSGDGNLRLMLSEVFAAGVLKDAGGLLPPDLFDQLSPDMPYNLARNADLFCGEDPDHLILKIRTMDLA